MIANLEYYGHNNKVHLINERVNKVQNLYVQKYHNISLHREPFKEDRLTVQVVRSINPAK